MADDLHIDQHKLKNIPAADMEAANKYFVDTTVAESYDWRHQINPFTYLMDKADQWTSESNINVFSFKTFANSLHPLNKNAYILDFLSSSGPKKRFTVQIGF